MSRKNNGKLLYYTTLTVYEHCEVPMRRKIHLSVLILKKRDLDFNISLDFMCESDNQDQQRVQCNV